VKSLETATAKVIIGDEKTEKLTKIVDERQTSN